MRFQESFLRHGHVLGFDAEQRVFAPGDACGSLYCLLDGAIRIGSVGQSGSENLVAIIEPVSWFGEPAIFEKCHRKYAACAEKDSQVFVLPHDYLHDMLEKDPGLWREVARLLARKLLLVLEGAEAVGSLPAAGRLAKRLIMISTNYGTWTGSRRRTISVSQDDLAKMIYLARATTNMLLKEFERKGLILLKYGRIELIDIEMIEEIAQGRIGIACESV